jgi:hypothetical protein
MNKQHPFHPIIYVRGFAGTQGEVEDTVADPYMGFNIGSTKARQLWTGEMKKFFFESPLVRLMGDYKYEDVYMDGIDQVVDPAATRDIPYQSVIIYRYYETASKDIGEGRLPEMEDYAKGLSDLIENLRDKVCAVKSNGVTPRDFKVYLVAHSMGGLVCRAFLQNKKLGTAAARAAVDKVFTYGTPHNGIDLKLIGNMPNWYSFHNNNDFNRKRMAGYLGLGTAYTGKKDKDDVSIVQNFDPDRIFNLVGTNARDYAVAGGAARFLAGDSSDGLVRCANATTHGKWEGKEVSSPRAFAFLSHSGHFGMVNSETGFQNLTRFFFGNVRVDGKLMIDELSLPPKVAKKLAGGKKIRASYHFETIVSVRGKQWEMHRRVMNENSAVFRKYDELIDPATGKPDPKQAPHLFSLFLDGRQRLNNRRESLGFAVDIRVVVPDYEVDGFLFLDDHFEGGYLFRDRIYFEATPPATDKDEWKLKYGYESDSSGDMPHAAVMKTSDEGMICEIPIEQPNPPGIKATLKITARSWN